MQKNYSFVSQIPVKKKTYTSCYAVFPAAPVKPAQPQLSRGKEKISAREMKERNLRFYNRLPEVRRKKVEEKRSATYESNRQKARAYQQVCTYAGYIHDAREWFN